MNGAEQMMITGCFSPNTDRCISKGSFCADRWTACDSEGLCGNLWLATQLIYQWTPVSDHESSLRGTFCLFNGSASHKHTIYAWGWVLIAVPFCSGLVRPFDLTLIESFLPNRQDFWFFASTDFKYTNTCERSDAAVNKSDWLNMEDHRMLVSVATQQRQGMKMGARLVGGFILCSVAQWKTTNASRCPDKMTSMLEFVWLLLPSKTSSPTCTMMLTNRSTVYTTVNTKRQNRNDVEDDFFPCLEKKPDDSAALWLAAIVFCCCFFVWTNANEMRVQEGRRTRRSLMERSDLNESQYGHWRHTDNGC